jgi:DNA-directed RNA polymerase subunit RPC12/RpoP/uncharacterized membrane protein YgaE (UPF0421/DUF939 family)
MYFKFQCTQCGKDLKAREDTTGANVRCPYCRATIAVPKPSAAGAPPPLPAAPKAETTRPAAVRESAAAAAREPAPAVAPSARPRAAAPALRKQPASQGDVFDNTHVSMPITALIGVGLTILFYAVLFPLSGTKLNDLFFHRGWVPPVEVFLMCWSVAILVWKTRKLSRQRETILLDVLPGDDDITPENVDGYLEHMRTLPAAPAESFLLNRVWRGLEHFRVRRSNPEVAEMLISQSDIDATAVNSSYTILNTFIWAIPILGFIGTVHGLGSAVSGFTGGLNQAQDINVLKQSLTEITSGLGIAFDTTLIALIMSLFLMLPTKSIQKSEEDMLNTIAEYCNENLLKRLNDGPAGQDHGDQQRREIQSAIDAAMVAHHAELQTWAKKLETIGASITQQVTVGWSGIHQQLQPALDQLGRLQQEAARLQQDFVGSLQGITMNLQGQTSRYQQDLLSAFQQAASGLQGDTGRMKQDLLSAFQGAAGSADAQIRALQQCAEQHQARISENVARLVDQIQQAMSGLAVRTGVVQDEVSASMRRTAETMDAYFGGLGQGIGRLSEVLERLGENQVVIQMPEPRRRRWWSFGRNSGGA